MVLAKPIVELIYQYGKFGTASTDQVSTALLWFSFSLPFAGVNLLLTRTFFSLQRPWIPTALAAANLVVNLILSLLLYKPFGIAGPVIGTAVASAGMTFAQGWYLRQELDGSFEGRATLLATTKILIASALLAAVIYGVWWPVDQAVGDATAIARLPRRRPVADCRSARATSPRSTSCASPRLSRSARFVMRRRRGA